MSTSFDTAVAVVAAQAVAEAFFWQSLRDRSVTFNPAGQLALCRLRDTVFFAWDAIHTGEEYFGPQDRMRLLQLACSGFRQELRESQVDEDVLDLVERMLLSL